MLRKKPRLPSLADAPKYSVSLGPMHSKICSRGTSPHTMPHGGIRKVVAANAGSQQALLNLCVLTRTEHVPAGAQSRVKSTHTNHIMGKGGKVRPDKFSLGDLRFLQDGHIPAGCRAGQHGS